MKKFLYTILPAFLLLLSPTIQFVNTQGVEIPTPREETWVKVSNEGVGAYGYTKWNPLTTPYACYEALNHLMGEFLWYDNARTGERVWWLVTGASHSEDFKQWTFYVRKGVHWSDGVPFTSKDIKFTVELIMKYPECIHYAYFNEWIDIIEVPDEYTVVFNLKKPNLRFDGSPWTASVWGFLLILPEHIWKDVEDPVSFQYENPVFTGPYKLYKVIPESNMFVFIRDENYWGKALGYMPEPKYVVIRGPVPPDLEYINWVQGSVDYIDCLYIPNELVELGLASGNPNVTIVDVFDPNADCVKINCAKYPLSVPEVRWAISYCINKEKLAKFFPAGAAAPCKGPFSNGWASEQYLTKWPDIFSKYGNIAEFNLTKAAEILDKLGFIDRDGDGIRETNNGTKLIFEFLYSDSAELAYYTDMALDMAESFEKVGMKLIPRRMAHAQIMDKRKYGEFDLVGWVAAGGLWERNDPLSFFGGWHSKYYAPIGQPGIGYATGECRWYDPELDSIIDQMQSMPPTDPRYEDLVKRAFDIYLKNLPVIPVFTRVNRFLISTRYWVGYPTPDNMYVYPQCWDPDMKWVIHNLKPTGATPGISYVNVWFIKDVPEFTGTDKRTYGPFKPGDFAKIPEDDALRLIAQGSASYTPPTYTYITVYAKTSIVAFTGVDGKTYGPFKEGDAMLIPDKDAERLVSEGKATYSPPVPSEIPEIANAVSDLLGRVSRLETTISTMRTELTSTISDLRSSISDLKSSVDALSAQIASTTTTAVGIGIVTIILVIVAIAIVMRKK
jgi:peptide/nickel transport system substrate-binding protein